MRPDEARAWQLEQARRAANARAAAKARQEQQQRDIDARNEEAERARKKANDEAIRANRERQKAKERKAEEDRKAQADYMQKLRQQGQQTYPYSPPVSPNPHPFGGDGALNGGGSRGKGKGAVAKGILVVICLFVAFAYFSSKSDRPLNPEPARAPERTDTPPMPAPEPPRTARPAKSIEPPQTAPNPRPTPVSPVQRDYRAAPRPSYSSPLPVLPRAPAPLQAVYIVKPLYPPIARQARMQGKISVVLEVGANGSVIHARAERGNPILAQAAEQAARQWRYSPYAAVPGKPPRTTVVNFDFNLDR
jgi:TonB family protein